MYRISDFSRITGITVKALRYYEEEEILLPSARGEANAYRYYSEKDFMRARLVVFLRDMSFSIAEIKDVLRHCEREADLSFYLEEKKNQIAENMRKERVLIEKIVNHINFEKTESASMDYLVEVKDYPAVTVASIRFRAKYGDISKQMAAIYKAVRNNGIGAPFCLYYDDDYKEEAEMEICVPTKKAVTDKTVASNNLPAVKAICTTHKGSYNGLSLAYKALLDYANGKNLNLKTPSREIYIKGPGMLFRGNENNYVTEIAIPFDGREGEGAF